MPNPWDQRTSFCRLFDFVAARAVISERAAALSEIEACHLSDHSAEVREALGLLTGYLQNIRHRTDEPQYIANGWLINFSLQYGDQLPPQRPRYALARIKHRHRLPSQISRQKRPHVVERLLVCGERSLANPLLPRTPFEKLFHSIRQIDRNNKNQTEREGNDPIDFATTLVVAGCDRGRNRSRTCDFTPNH